MKNIKFVKNDIDKPQIMLAMGEGGINPSIQYSDQLNRLLMEVHRVFIEQHTATIVIAGKEETFITLVFLTEHIKMMHNLIEDKGIKEKLGSLLEDFQRQYDDARKKVLAYQNDEKVA